MTQMTLKEVLDDLDPGDLVLMITALVYEAGGEIRISHSTRTLLPEIRVTITEDVSSQELIFTAHKESNNG